MEIVRNDTEQYVPTLKDVQPGQCFIDKDIDGTETVCMMTDYTDPQIYSKGFVDLETGKIWFGGDSKKVRLLNAKVVVEDQK